MTTSAAHRTAGAPTLASVVAGRRRRGAELEDAICRAAFEELSDTGYAAFTIESVAARAGTGKASIYRRWPTKDHLLLDAFSRGIPSPDDCLIAEELPDSLGTRDAIVQGMLLMVRMGALKGEATHAIASEAARDPELGRALDRVALTPRREAFELVLRRGVARGEVRPDAPFEWISELVPALMITRKLFRHVPVDESTVADLVDNIIWPLIRA